MFPQKKSKFLLLDFKALIEDSLSLNMFSNAERVIGALKNDKRNNNHILEFGFPTSKPLHAANTTFIMWGNTQLIPKKLPDITQKTLKMGQCNNKLSIVSSCDFGNRSLMGNTKFGAWLYNK